MCEFFYWLDVRNVIKGSTVTASAVHGALNSIPVSLIHTHRWIILQILSHVWQRDKLLRLNSTRILKCLRDAEQKSKVCMFYLCNKGFLVSGTVPLTSLNNKERKFPTNKSISYHTKRTLALDAADGLTRAVGMIRHLTLQLDLFSCTTDTDGKTLTSFGASKMTKREMTKVYDKKNS